MNSDPMPTDPGEEDNPPSATEEFFAAHPEKNLPEVTDYWAAKRALAKWSEARAEEVD